MPSGPASTLARRNAAPAVRTSTTAATVARPIRYGSFASHGLAAEKTARLAISVGSTTSAMSRNSLTSCASVVALIAAATNAAEIDADQDARRHPEVAEVGERVGNGIGVRVHVLCI